MPDQGTSAMSVSEADDEVQSLRASIQGINLKDTTTGAVSSTTKEQHEAAKPSTQPQGQKKLPMVLPQLTSEKGVFGSPFVRAYPKELESYGISKPDFLTFLDGFNDTFVASPSAQSLSFAGRVLQLAYGHKVVEVDTVQTKGSTSASNPEIQKSFGKVLLYLQAINKNIFHPAGLHVQLLKTEDMVKKINYPADKLKLLPIDSTQVSVADQMVVAQRLKPLEGFVSELDLDVPKSAASDNFFKRISEERHERKEKLQARRQARQDQFRDRAQKRADRKDGSLSKKLEKLEAELLGHKEKSEKKLAKDPNNKAIGDEFERTKARIVREMDRLTKKRPGDIKSHKKDLSAITARAESEANKVQWMVITQFGTRFESAKVEDGSSSEFDVSEADYLSSE